MNPTEAIINDLHSSDAHKIFHIARKHGMAGYKCALARMGYASGGEDSSYTCKHRQRETNNIG